MQMDHSSAKCRTVTHALIALLAVALATAASAQPPVPDDETVFVADVNNSVHQISNGSAFLKFTIGGTNFRDLIVTDNLRFIIANHTQNGTVLLSDENGVNTVITSAIAAPEGLDIGPDDEVYVSTAANNNVYKLTRNTANCPVLGPSCPNGGYSLTGNPLITVAGAQLVADVAVVWSDPTGTSNPGDVLVLVAAPASIRRYSATGTNLGSLSVSFEGEQPSAMAFGPGGTILVTTEQGSIWQFPPGGGAAISKIGGKARGIAFGIQGGAAVAFVSVDPGSVVKYPFSGNAILDAPTAISAFNNPRGVSFAGAGGASLAEGANVQVRTPAGVTTYESVPAGGGQADAECYFFQDPRTAPGSLALSTVQALPQFLRTQLAANDVIIPANVQCFVPNGGSAGLCRLCITKTTALVDGIKQVASEESAWLNGKDPGCPLVAWEGESNHANTFYAPEVGKGEYPIIEWSSGSRVVQNVTNACGSDVSWSRGRGSLLLLSAIDTTSRRDLVLGNLSLFESTVSSTSDGSLSGFILSTTLKSSLLSAIQTAQKAASKRRYADVVAGMTGILGTLDSANPADFTPTGTAAGMFGGNNVLSPDVRAELKARAGAIRFAACSELSAGRGRGKKALPTDCEALISNP